MKYSTFIYSILITILFPSCHKDGDNVKPISYFCAELNGKSWQGETWAYIDNGDKLSIISQVYKQKIRQDRFSITYIPISKGRNTLRFPRKDSITFNLAGTNYRTLYEDGEYSCDEYTLVMSDSVNNHVEITDFDLDEKTFKGTFSGTYVRSTTNICDATKPDTMKFRKGKFNIRMK